MTLTQSINIYGKRYENGKSYFTNIKSDFDIIREIEKYINAKYMRFVMYWHL